MCFLRGIKCGLGLEVTRKGATFNVLNPIVKTAINLHDLYKTGPKKKSSTDPYFFLPRNEVLKIKNMLLVNCIDMYFLSSTY